MQRTHGERSGREGRRRERERMTHADRGKGESKRERKKKQNDANNTYPTKHSIERPNKPQHLKEREVAGDLSELEVDVGDALLFLRAPKHLLLLPTPLCSDDAVAWLTPRQVTLHTYMHICTWIDAQMHLCKDTRHLM